MDPASLGFKEVAAQALFPSDGLTGFDPIETYGDGNCLFRSMSRILCGNEDMHVELRVGKITVIQCADAIHVSFLANKSSSHYKWPKIKDNDKVSAKFIFYSSPDV